MTGHALTIVRRMPRRLARLGVAAALLLAFWLGGLIWFVAAMPDEVVDPDTPADAIVVLTGGSARLAAGLDLLAHGKGKKLFVSGVYKGVEVAELVRLSRHAPSDFDCCVVLGYTADNTRGNAVETAEWARREGYRSLRLVTAGYHMHRSLLEFRAAMPETEVIPHPVFPDHVKQQDWWRWPGTTALYIGEYDKYLIARARLLFGTLLGGGAS